MTQEGLCVIKLRNETKQNQEHDSQQRLSKFQFFF